MHIGHLIIFFVTEKGELELLSQQSLLKLCNVMASDIDLLLMLLSHS
jgi:hypothetical protein